MADAIVSFALESLNDLLVQETKFLSGVSDQVQNMQIELKKMRCFLKDADSKASNGDERVRNWVAEIRDLAYDAEDVIETYALKVQSGRWEEGITNVFKRRHVGSEIEAITSRLSNLSSSLKTYGIKDLKDGSSSTAQHRPPSYSHDKETYIVGRDKSTEELVKHLVDNENCRLVSICGMGGLGKTTLARKVYHHTKVKCRFDYLAWSCISQPCKERDVWQEILTELTSPSKEQKKEIKELSNRELVKKLFQVLQEKRCLIILDDIWSIQAWNSLRVAFPREETSSKILITTRNQEVALHADPTGFHYEPLCLDEEESWELLQKIAIPQKDGEDLRIDTRMEGLGKKMVKHCRGLPLAITVLGGLLATKYSSNEWHRVHETIKSSLRRGKGHGQEQLGVFDVLALSYNDLPTELKLCFLYIILFPEDYEIDVHRLIQLWIAEGIINSKESEETMEDVAERYLNELVKRCMVLVGERDASLRITTCRMHDLMRDLFLSKAKEEIFFHIVNCQNGDENVDIFPSSSSGKIRRLAIYLHQHRSKGILKRIKNPHHLRFFLCFFESDKEWSLDMPVFNNLQLLRALAIEGYNVRLKLPKDIGKLIHLRYLSLRYAMVDKLPSSLGNLRCLQTLDLRIESIVYVPDVLWKMENLRHLYLPEQCDNKKKLRLGNLRSLQTLVNFSLTNFDVSELLKNMTNLRESSIRDLYLIKDFGETFKSRGITVKHLRSLTLNNDIGKEKIDVLPLVSCCINLYVLKLCASIEKLPDYHQLPSSITDIALWHTELEEDPMATLEKLPNIRNLSLSINAFTGKQMVCSREGFSRLHTLRLFNLPNFEEWRVDEGAMPNLCHLEIASCMELKTFPDGLRFVKTLQKLEIRLMLKEFTEKLVEGRQDFYKVQNVPSVIFKDNWW